jgi:hypothetical protein
MARPKTQKAAKATGPYLASALFCDNVIQGADHSLSAIRIIDQITITLPADAPKDMPSEEKRLPVSVWALIVLKTGLAKKLNRKVRLVMHSPSGKSQTVGEHDVNLSSEPQGGANIRINVNIAIKEGGLFWLDVLLDDAVVTRMPLAISVQRQQPKQPTSPPPPPRRRSGAAQAPPPVPPPGRRRRAL